MIERLFVDNIRSFVNFQFRPTPIALLAGPNGAGKTALLQILLALKDFLLGSTSSEEAFPEGSQTRWDSRTEQTVELDVRHAKGLFKYRLVVERDPVHSARNRVRQETLHHESTLLVDFVGGTVHLFRDSGEQGPRFNARWNRSAIGMVEPARDSSLLIAFKSWIAGLDFLRPDPRAMAGRYPKRTATLASDLSNFCAWYMEMLATRPGTMFKANAALGQVLEGFVELFDLGGQIFARFEQGGVTTEYGFEELSDGQRALIALYVLRHALLVPGRVVMVDEPDNYVAAREIQPWLHEVIDAALRPGGPQVWLISHHPELMNVLARDYGWFLFRDPAGPSRIERYPIAPGLDAAETAARGWEHAE